MVRRKDFQKTEGATALHCVLTSEDSTRIVPLLLAAGADPNARGAGGETSLNRVRMVFIELREAVGGATNPPQTTTPLIYRCRGVFSFRATA
ncbi:MAG: hypothetical protein GX751_05880 [Desulfuromonadaceae bacterium]|nr:hypothetical protein [Desulfuromonadaceae bacterium]